MQLTDPAKRLSRDEYPFLQRAAVRAERLARSGRPPAVRQRLLAIAPGQDPAAWPSMRTSELLTFAGDVEPVLLDAGSRCYRIVGDGSYPNGAFWMLTRPNAEDTMRRDYAILNDWNGDHGLVVLELARPLRAWAGAAAPQPSSDRRGHLPGGSRQLWVPAGALGPLDGRWTLEQL